METRNRRNAGALWTAVGLVVTMGAFTGCESVMGPGGDAEIEVQVAGDSGAAAGSGPSYSWSGSGSATAEGTVEVRARVWVESTGGEWREVTRGAASQRVEIDGRDGFKVLARGRVESDTYQRVRIEFERVEADVRSGLWIGVGTLTGGVRVGEESEGKVVVEREISLRAEERHTNRVQIGLNAEQWLERADTGSRVVAAADFRSAVKVYLQ